MPDQFLDIVGEVEVVLLDIDGYAITVGNDGKAWCVVLYMGTPHTVYLDEQFYTAMCRAGTQAGHRYLISRNPLAQLKRYKVKDLGKDEGQHDGNA